MTVAASKSPVKILLLDDHELFREGLARLIAAEPEFHLVNHCGSIPEAVAVLAEKHIDLILLDIDLGSADGTELLERLPSLHYSGRVLVITGGVDDARARDLLSRGIAGIFMKHKSPVQLMQSIKHVMEGWTWLDQHHLRLVMQPEPKTERTAHERFTSREKQVLRMVVQGLQNKEIAADLNISESAAKASMQQLFNKTGVRKRSQLVRVALERYKEEIEEPTQETR
jgi:DNA-binding NarL/FixJ family response regulator